MKRSAFLTSLCLIASLLAGCASNQTNDQQPQGQILQGQAKAIPDNDPFLSEKDPPLSAQTHFAAGQFAEAEKNYTVAAQQYEKACAIQEDYLLAQYRLGVVYCHLKNWDKAVATWNNYIESTNGSANAWSNLGFCYELMGDGPRAEQAYLKGLAKDPRNHPCRVNYGLYLARRSKIPEAVKQFEGVITPAEIHYNLASIFEQQGRMRLARAEFEKALQLDPLMADARTRMAAISFTQ